MGALPSQALLETLLSLVMSSRVGGCGLGGGADVLLGELCGKRGEFLESMRVKPWSGEAESERRSLSVTVCKPDDNNNGQNIQTVCMHYYAHFCYNNEHAMSERKKKN